jgi:hypothetical protein
VLPWTTGVKPSHPTLRAALFAQTQAFLLLNCNNNPWKEKTLVVGGLGRWIARL